MRGDHLEDEGLDDQRVVVVGLGAMVLKIRENLCNCLKYKTEHDNDDEVCRRTEHKGLL